MTKTLYLNLEDDVAKIVAKLKREKSESAVLVFPKKSFIFSDSINLKLLKKQIDMIDKEVFILTMDERGQEYAQAAGFQLKHLPKSSRANSFSDIRPRTTRVPETVAVAEMIAEVAAEEDAQDPEPVYEEPIIKTAPRRASAERSRSFITPAKISRPNIRSTEAAPLRVAHKDNVFMPAGSKVAPPRTRKSYRAYVIGFIALALVVVMLLVLVVLPSASIVVYAKNQSIARDLDITADVNAQTTDSSKLTVPVVVVNETQTIADNFQANGKKELGSKAEGRIAIYNLTGSPMALKAATTTLTVGSKTYVFKQDQPLVKALTSAASDANATVADVVATEGGESFNVPAGTRMEITNQAFGSQPQRLYAKTVTQIVGGNSRFVSVVSKEDMDNAQKELTKRVVDGINANLAAREARLVEGAYNISVISYITDKPEGTEGQNFASTLQVNISGLAFNENALKNMVRQRLLTTLGAGRNLQDANVDKVIYKIKNLDLQNGLMQLSLHYESNAKPNLQQQDIRNKVAGKTKEEASDVILANPDVDHIEITVQPAWQSSLPRFGSKIHLEIKQ